MVGLLSKALRIRKTIGVLALAGTTLLGVGCGGGDDSGSERAVEWRVDRPVGPDWVRLSASIEVYSIDLPLLEEPIIEYKGNRVYIEPHRNRDGPELVSDAQGGASGYDGTIMMGRGIRQRRIGPASVLRGWSTLIALVVLICCLLLEPAGAMAAEYTVNSIGDQVDEAPGSNGCKTTVDTCTLRAAIEESNASTGINDTSSSAPPLTDRSTTRSSSARRFQRLLIG